MKFKALCVKWSVVTAWFFCFSTQAALWSITYPRPIDDKDIRTEYPLALLSLALEKTGVKYSLLPSDRIMLKGKALRQLKENREINIVWSMTDAQREKDLLPIRIPLAKGLIGWRVFIVNETNKNEFSQIKDRTSLLRKIPVSGEEWPDTKILQANGFNVFTVPAATDAFEVIERGSADFFPRSVIEIQNEMQSDDFSGTLALEDGLAIYYPTAMYFFVNKSNPTLARLIETGLKMALEDGSFDALFMATYQETLESLNLQERNTINLDNTLLPPLTPVDNATLWYAPEKLK